MLPRYIIRIVLNNALYIILFFTKRKIFWKHLQHFEILALQMQMRTISNPKTRAATITNASWLKMLSEFYGLILSSEELISARIRWLSVAVEFKASVVLS